MEFKFSFIVKNTAKQYRILGQSFSIEELKSICLEKISVLGTPAWERDIWSFILQWFSPDKTIDVNTSGSTGVPKTIALHKKDMVESAKATLSFFNLTKRDSALLCLPVQYIAGKMMIVRALTGGMDLHFIEPASTLNLSTIGQCSFSAMTPMQVVNILETVSGKNALEQLNTLIVGGSAFPYGLNEKLQSLKSNIWQTYGMTETMTHIALRPVNGDNSSEWYQSLSGVSLNQDEKGCLVIDYPKIGVHQMATNDIVELNKKNQFKILGRIDHMVNSGGLKLFPESLEQKLFGILPFDFFMAGIADPVLGEKLVMVIECVNLSKENLNELRIKVESNLSRFEKPKEYFCIPKFIKTENGKIQRLKTVNQAVKFND